MTHPAPHPPSTRDSAGPAQRTARTCKAESCCPSQEQRTANSVGRGGFSRRCHEELMRRRCVECGACTIGRCAYCGRLVCLDCWPPHKAECQTSDKSPHERPEEVTR